ncbi:uncharacterized protein PAC_05979 [Phialocephala subalpina]|uniref:Heterokaryon incompatibility domain-containing protein n=1 Tax=Phialocephala subalpina TaxID=576137 RepID=A0A1L7WTJ7_9HELO|nr:uncharacterized protein PAC_05979 [Phialocephala subalpina]
MEMHGCHCAVPIVKPKVELHKHGKCSTKPYLYQPLASPTSIRLLKVQPFSGSTHVCEEDLYSPLKCSLVTVDLVNNSSYTALSYTWRDPMVYYSSETDIVPPEDWYCQCHTIDIDGEEVTISTNLYTAIISLRHIKSATRYAKSDGLQEDTEYIWIDALCINQSNLIEKSSQVQLMDRIYLQSKHVLVWLGGAGTMSDTSIVILNKLFELGMATRNEEGQHVGLELLPEMELDDSRFYEILGMEWHISPQEWSHIFAFLNRSWFRRTWVIQELGLAKKAAVSQNVNDWDTEMFLSLEYVRHKQIVASKEAAIGKGVEQEGLVPISQRLMLFRSTQASDPRDKIYAFLGISNGGTLPIPQFLVPDYSFSPAQVYIQWAGFMIPSDTHFCLLSMVEDPSLRKVERLPSWVPDFSTDCRPIPFQMPAPLPFRAGRRLGPMYAKFPEPGVLEVQGYMLNKISAVVKVSHLEKAGIKAIADFLAPLPRVMMIKKPNTEFRPDTTEIALSDYQNIHEENAAWESLLLPDEMTPLHKQILGSQSGTGDNIIFLTGGDFPNMPEEWLDKGDNLH